MKRTYATSTQAKQAENLVSSLQQRFVQGLEKISDKLGLLQTFKPVEWLRDEGKHGGGIRYETADGAMIGRGSVNVSQIHYDDNPEKKLGSATAISTIIHPNNPTSPSVHIHISWTEMKDGSGYWRMMADLNPANDKLEDKQTFLNALQQAAPEQFESAVQQGNVYFYIPVLERHRGIAHFYLEAYNSEDNTKDLALAQSVGEAAIDTYINILENSLKNTNHETPEEKAKQLAYHTLYFFQVLTLDRGTTTGLLVHNQNDVGIMGSLPAYVDRDLLQSWVRKMQQPQDKLLQGLIDVLPNSSPCLIDENVKQKLAQVVRQHYQNFPEAIAMQAAGHTIPPTVQNHS
ncbi:coproporphyrinogen III oxidase [Ghiorsea bivora]|uniref:coproporphyrinogen III oxidase n=1 Tax=Ghiorsea bivora TaxID=1485545 RepID=UPI00057046BC|nr:coproporphyrinogen III oxidase [Ghiorsea bivora]